MTRSSVAALGTGLALAGTLVSAGIPDRQLAPAPPPGQSTITPPPARPGGTPQVELAPAVPPVRGRYLDAVPSVVHGTGSQKGRVTLAVDISPKAAMRVYAPGNSGYTAIALAIDGQPAGNVGPTVYPRAEDYLFVPLNERFKVYSSPFRLTRDVTVGSSTRPAASSSAPPAGTVIAGRLEYQACDDKVCYLPQSLPLTWTIKP